MANRRLTSADLGSGSADAVKIIYNLGPRYAKRRYTRVLKAGFRMVICSISN